MKMKQHYETYGPMVYRRCFSIVKEEFVAQDLTQDVFVKVFEAGLHQVSSSYFYTIATNLSLNYLRDNTKFSNQNEMLNQILSDEDIETKVSQKKWLSSFFKKQLADSKTIAYMHWVDGFTLEEVAQSVGLSVSGVRKRLASLKESKGLLLEIGVES